MLVSFGVGVASVHVPDAQARSEPTGTRILSTTFHLLWELGVKFVSSILTQWETFQRKNKSTSELRLGGKHGFLGGILRWGVWFPVNIPGSQVQKGGQFHPYMHWTVKQTVSYPDAGQDRQAEVALVRLCQPTT